MESYDVKSHAESWDQTLAQAEAKGEIIGVSGRGSGSQRSRSESSEPSTGSSDKDKHLVKVVGNIGCKFAKVDPLTDEEVSELADAFVIWLNARFPDTILPPELALLASVGTIVAARKDQFIEAHAKDEEPEQEGAPQVENVEEF